MTIIAIHQSNYMPWIPYFSKISESDVFIFFDDSQYQKNVFMNRNKIKTTGEYSVDIDLHPEVNCSLDIEILSPKTSA